MTFTVEELDAMLADHMVKVKICRTCGEKKLKSEFSKQVSCKDGHRPDCKSCRLQMGADRRALVLVATKKCVGSCGLTLPIKDFRGSHSNADGYLNICMKCATAYHVARRRLKGTGWTVLEYEAAFKAQDGKCAICHRAPIKTSLSADHNHDTMKKRGLLCMPCNQALGLLSDSPDLLIAAADYLRKYTA